MKKTKAQTDDHALTQNFTNYFNSIRRHIPWDVNWILQMPPNALIHDPMRRYGMQKNGDEAVSMDCVGRRLVLIRSLYGNVILFEREKDRSDIISIIAPEAILKREQLQNPDQLTRSELSIILSANYRHHAVGQRMEKLLGQHSSMSSTV